MNTDIIVNVKEASDEDIVVPNTDSDSYINGSPNTGYLTVDNGTNTADSAISSSILTLSILSVVIIVTIAVFTLITRKRHANFVLNRGKHASYGLIALAIIVSILSCAGLKELNHTYDSANAEGGNELAEQGDTLSIATTDARLDITLEDEPVYAYMKNTVSVSSPTEAGYTLSAYMASDSKDLLNSTDGGEVSSGKISGLSSIGAQNLTDNTWGIALQEPTSKDSNVFHGLPTDENEPLLLNVKGASTDAGDSTDVYIGAYVVPGLPAGTYTGATVNYTAVANVVTGDITVKYHGNGLYFDEAGTKDENTVVYGRTCGMVYVGGNCTKSYTTTEPAEILKTVNINDDGTQNGSYPKGTQGDSIVFEQVLTIPGADKIRLAIDFGVVARDSILIAEGEWDRAIMGNQWDYQNDLPDSFIEIGGLETNESDSKVLTFNGDTVTVLMSAWNNESEIEDYNYGFYAKAFPIYNEKPNDKNVTETSVCNIYKSSNLDDEGNQLSPYGESSDLGLESIVIPGADGLKVDLTYGLTVSTAYIEIIEGNIWDAYRGEIVGKVEDISTYWGEDIAGTKTILFDSNRLSLEYLLHNNNNNKPLTEGYDYGFYIKITPIYNQDRKGSVPEKVCTFEKKSGEYMEIIGNEIINWYSEIDVVDSNTPNATKAFDQGLVYSYLDYHYDDYEGKTFNLYATNNYIIHFDANGGEGEMEDQLIYSGNISTNSFVKDGYAFDRWNTKADGSGVSYYNEAQIHNLAKPGQVVTLYAQWYDLSGEAVVK